MSKEHTPEPWEKDDFERFPFTDIVTRGLHYNDFNHAVNCVNSCAAIEHPEKIYRCLTMVQDILSAALTNQNHIDTDSQLCFAIGLIEETLGED